MIRLTTTPLELASIRHMPYGVSMANSIVAPAPLYLLHRFDTSSTLNHPYRWTLLVSYLLVSVQGARALLGYNIPDP